MSNFDSITKYLKYFDNGNLGKWETDRKSEDTFENYIQIPFVEYSKMVSDLENDIYCFVDKNQDMNLNHYNEILEKNGIEWSSKSMEEADISKIDDQCLMALLVGVLRADRFCEGTLLSFLNNGCIKRWLLKLKEIDDKVV